MYKCIWIDLSQNFYSMSILFGGGSQRGNPWVECTQGWGRWGRNFSILTRIMSPRFFNLISIQIHHWLDVQLRAASQISLRSSLKIQNSNSNLLISSSCSYLVNLGAWDWFKLLSWYGDKVMTCFLRIHRLLSIHFTFISNSLPSLSHVTMEQTRQIQHLSSW